MRFAVDAHAIGRHLTGNEVYVRSLLNAFAAPDQDDEFIAYVSADSAARYIPANIRTRRISTNPFMRLGFDLAMKVRQDRPDLLHVQYTAPIACPVPVVVSVHDVSFLEHPEYFTRDRAWQLQWSVRRTVHRAARILTGSEFSRSSILKVYGDLDEDKVVVVPNAAAPEFRPIAREAAAAVVREHFDIAVPFVLSVGDLQPRKNQIGLIRAFAQLVQAYPQLKQNLVLAGKETWFGDQVHRAARDSGVADRIQFCGFVSDADLLQLYNACDLFIFPSFYEGFGLPALEARNPPRRRQWQTAFGCSPNPLQLLNFRCLHQPLPLLGTALAEGVLPVAPRRCHGGAPVWSPCGSRNLLRFLYLREIFGILGLTIKVGMTCFFVPLPGVSHVCSMTLP